MARLGRSQPIRPIIRSGPLVVTGPVHLFTETPAVTAENDDVSVSLGTEFYVTRTAQITKVRYLQPATGGTLAARTMALYRVDDGANGTMVAGPFTMPTPTAGAWCEYTLPTAYQLTTDQRYRIVAFHPANARYSATSNYFVSGAGADPTTFGGYLVRPDVDDAVSNDQGSYAYGASITFPTSGFNGSAYYSDIEATSRKTEELKDDFASAIDKVTKWPQTSTAVVWDSSGRAKIPCTTDYWRMATHINGGYDLTGSSFMAQITTPAVGTGTRQTFMEVWRDGAPTDGLRMYRDGDDLVMRIDLGGFDNLLEASSTTYNATDHAWWRIRESVGTVYFDTAPDGVTWTNRWSRASAFNVSNVVMYFLSGYYGTESAADAYIDNVNTPPTGASGTATISGAGSVTALATQIVTATATGVGVTTAAPYTPPPSYPQVQIARRASSVIGTTGSVWTTTSAALDGAVGEHTLDSYAVFTTATPNAVGTIDLGFNFTNVPSTAVIERVIVAVDADTGSSPSFTSATMQIMDGSTAIGSPFEIGEEGKWTQYRMLDTLPTIAQLRSSSLKVRISITHDSSTTSDHFDIDFADMYVVLTPASSVAKRGSSVVATNGTTWANTTNALDGAVGSTPATYATWTNAVNGGTGYIEIGGFGFDTLIGTSDTVIEVAVTLNSLVSSLARITSLSVQLYDDTTAIGSAQNAVLSITAHNDVFMFTATLAQVRSSTFKVRVSAVHAANTQSLVLSIDHVDVNVAYLVTTPSITQAAYRFYADGTESGGTALAAQDTSYAVDLTSGDMNLVLRVRMQTTDSGVVTANDYFQLQREINNTGTWVNVEPATGGDSFTSTNSTQSVDGASPMIAQSFLGNGQRLKQVTFQLTRESVFIEDISVYAVLYEFYGKLGKGRPVGSRLNAMAVSTAINALTIPTTATQITFNFDESFTLLPDVPYAIGFYSTQTGSNNISVAEHTAGSHGGEAFDFPNDWDLQSIGTDLYFSLLTSAPVTPTGAVPFSSANLTDQGATTSRLTGGSGTFVAGKVTETGLVKSLGWSANNHTELLFAITLKQSELSNGDSVKFRVLRDGSTTGLTYTQVPTLNVSGADIGTAAISGAGSVGALATQGATATVTGAGAVTALSRQIPSTTAVVGAGAVNALATQIIAATATAGTGSVAASGESIVTATATVAGTGVVGLIPVNNLLTADGASVETSIATIATDTCTITRSSADAAHGSYSVLATQTGGTNYQVLSNVPASVLTALNAAVDGSRWTVYASVKLNSPGPQVARVYLMTNLGDLYETSSSTLPVSSSFTNFVNTFTIPAGTFTDAYVAVVVVDNSGTGSVYVDKFGIVEGDTKSRPWALPGATLTDVNVIVSATASVVGAGATNANGSVIGATVNGDASVVGAGSVTALATQRSATVVLAGLGSVNVPVVRQSVIAPVTGAGVVNAPLVRQTVTASVVGAGAITALATQRVISTVTGAGTVSVAAIQRTTSPVAGTGTVNVPLATQVASASVTGAGSVVANGTQIGNSYGTVAVTGVGTTTALATQRSGVVALAGVGSVNTPIGVAQSTTTIAGVGAVNAPLVRQGSTTSVSGVGSGTSVAVQRATAQVVGVGAIVANSGGVASGSATVSGTGAVTAQVRMLGASSVSGVGAVAALAVQRITSTVAGQGTVNALATALGTSSVVGAGSVVANGFIGFTGTATVTGAGTTTSLARIAASSSVTGVGATAANALGSLSGTASVAGVGSTAAVIRLTTFAPSLNGVGAVGALVTVQTGKIILGQGSVVAAGIKGINGQVDLSATALATSGGALSKNAIATLTIYATFLTQGGLTRAASATLGAIGHLNTIAGTYGAEYAYVLVGNPALDEASVAAMDTPEYAYVY